MYRKGAAVNLIPGRGGGGRCKNGVTQMLINSCLVFLFVCFSFNTTHLIKKKIEFLQISNRTRSTTNIIPNLKDIHGGLTSSHKGISPCAPLRLHIFKISIQN